MAGCTEAAAAWQDAGASPILILFKPVGWLHRLRRQVICAAVVISSTNAERTLEAAEIVDSFDAKVDGNVAMELKLAGKPEPDTYLEAARRVDAAPSREVVVEDALSGVQAGNRGGFGLVMAVAHNVSPAGMRHNGADVIVSDLGDLLPPGD